MSAIGNLGVRIHDDQTDRIGIRTLILKQLWQAAPGRTAVQELDEQAPLPPTPPRGMELIGQQRRPEGGGLREYWSYTGVRFDAKGPVVRTYGRSNDFWFEPGFAQVSLLKHRKIRRLLADFGGAVLDSQIVWPPTVATGQERNVIGFGDAARNDMNQTNPMFGHQDFIRFEGTYYYRYVAENLNGLTRGVRIVPAGSLPGAAPSYGDRDYLVGPEAYQRHAGFYAITIEAWLSGEGGWNRHIYGGSIG